MVYIRYIQSTKPHTNDVFNRLELFNEGSLILLCYIMLAYSGIIPIDQIIDNEIPLFASLIIAALIVAVNFGIMLEISYKKLLQKYKVEK